MLKFGPRVYLCIYFFFSFVSLETQTLAAFSHKETVQKEVKASVSQKATLSCNVSDSKTEVKWYKDGKLLISSRAVYSEAKGDTRQLVIEKVEKSDAGEYTCEAGGDKLVFKITVTGTRPPFTSIDCIKQIWIQTTLFFFPPFVPSSQQQSFKFALLTNT